MSQGLAEQNVAAGRREVGRQGARLWRLALSLGVGVLCLLFLFNALEAGAFAGLGAALGSLGAWQWLGALIATGLSFVAVGQYDVMLHRHFRTGVPAREAAISGAAAIAIAQTVGVGVMSGALVRWRLLPGIRLTQAGALSVCVAVTFFLGLALAIGLAGIMAPVPVLPLGLAPGLIALVLACLALAFLYPVVWFGRRAIRLPGLRVLVAVCGLTLIDVAFAALALWCLLPDPGSLGLGVLVPAYLLALGAALLSGTPGGLGPFELVLVGLLPQLPGADLLCAIVAFRLIYYAVPAVLAGLLVLRSLSKREGVDRVSSRAYGAGPSFRPLHEADLRGAARSEAGLCRQAEAEILGFRNLRLPVIRPGQSLCMMFGYLRGAPRGALALLDYAARQEGVGALVYKADARLAAEARVMGWQALRVADDMVVRTQGFRTEGRMYRQLRRKLRQAEAAGVLVTRASTLPWGAMQELDAEWQARQGAARGVTMGRFCPVYLCHQVVFLARVDECLVGFASFHKGRDGWCLDLMRTGHDAPDGTMHMLLTQAMQAARFERVREVSLAAVPPRSGAIAWLAARLGPAEGLAQFKTCFAPYRVPRYALAPGPCALWLGLADLWLARRRAHGGEGNKWPAPGGVAQDHHEPFEFARAREV